MGLHGTDENHYVLGNIKQILDTLVQQRLGLGMDGLFVHGHFVATVALYGCFISLLLFCADICRKKKLMAPKVVLWFMSLLR